MRQWYEPSLSAWAYLWALPNTLLALCITMLLLPFGVKAFSVEGVIEVEGGLAGWILAKVMRVSCATLGHVVFGVSEEDFAYWRVHERVHVRQNEMWGVAWLPCYLLSSLWALARGKNMYYDNWFEIQAYSVAP